LAGLIGWKAQYWGWLKFGRIDRLEGAILGVSAKISQIPDAPGMDGAVSIFLF
jgi:hypothetical protein